MAWVPIHESGVAYAFWSDEDGGDMAATMVGSTIALSGDQGWLIPWRLYATNVVDLPPLRLTFSDFESSSGVFAAKVDVSGVGSIDNAAGSPASEWVPNPIETQPSPEISYVNSTDSEGGGMPDSYSLLVEAWVDGEVSYNCECDDDYPSKTLAQMREFLMIRLGWGAMKDTPLPGVVDTLNSFIVDAQEQIYRQYKVFRMERYFTWGMEPGVRFYDLLANRDECTKKLDPRMVTWVGVSQEANTWRPLVCGIRPTMYWGEIQSIPTHYEIRQCIEVWPAPQDDTWQLRIKGYFGLLPLVLDTDINTVDYEAIQLYALANAKAHYGQPDAANYMAQYREYVGRVTAGSHHTRRYVPGTDEFVSPPLPVLTGWPGDP